ncbi:aldehyde dehydrogenase family 3 member I1, chloroplastic-like isoform X2 [Vitis riparia]|uniref:aldehyde dehydrogenase family 3 member I1, chloroplastic-like isoform X2 n=1 Tax=Vitis riparia TaxID=96939 RepID=UPI00155AE836|nr:aldehyde dehydrogenase family 3 member I1, chloroplastic-like isoform X2 [Vitis riparia]
MMRSLSLELFHVCSVDGGYTRSLRNQFPKQRNPPLPIPVLKKRKRLRFTHSSFICSATLAVMADEKKKVFDVESAASLVKELRGSFNAGKTKSYEWRIAQLKGIEKMIDEREKDIIEALHEDLSKPEHEAFVSEISMSKGACKLALKELGHWMKPEKAKTSMTTYPSSAEIVSEPLGVVLVISTWNYPLCSPRVGRIVMAAAAKHLTPVTLELGGKCPVVVDSNVNLQVAARRIIAGKWGCNNGQACIAPDYIITTKDFAPKLIDVLRHELEEFFGKNPIESEDMSRIVSVQQFKRLTRLLDEDEVSDKIIIGGQSDENQLKIAPTILVDVPEDTEIMKEEIFGPLLPILTVENLEESFDVINSKSKPLAAYLFSENKQLQKDFVNNISAGGMLINDTILHLTVSSLPFGGVGESGMGSYHGKFSFDAFSHKKAVLYRGFTGESPARYPPYTPGKLKLLKTLTSGNIVSILLALLGFSKD